MNVDERTLTSIVRLATQRPAAQLVDWRTETIHGGIGDLGAGLVGVYRCAGHASDHGEIFPWSIVLKSAQGYGEQPIVDYRTREWLAYNSGFLSDLSGDITAPQCYGTTRQPDGALQIWMVDLGGFGEQQWRADHYKLAAQHFGAWNGAYLLTEGQPNHPWFCRSAATEWMQQAAPEVEVLRSSLTHPIVKRLYPDGHAQTILQLWDERDRYLRTLQQLPQTICHNDAFRRNLHIHYGATGVPQVTAIDWTYLGWGAIGEELAALVMGNLEFHAIPWAQAEAFADMSFQAYLSGLRQAGWRGDPQLVRLGFTAAATLKYSFPYVLSKFFTEEGQAWLSTMFNDQPLHTANKSYQERHFVFALAEEARDLMGKLGC
ncbi:MAG: phosphotransferase [Caldilineaceae bacterium]